MLRGFLRRVTVGRDQKYKPFPSLKEKLESFSLSRIQKKNPSFSVRWILHDQGMILIQFLILFQFLMDLFMCSDSAANTLSICRKRRTSVYPHGMQNLLGPRSPLHSALYHPFAFSFFLSFFLSPLLFFCMFQGDQFWNLGVVFVDAIIEPQRNADVSSCENGPVGDEICFWLFGVQRNKLGSWLGFEGEEFVHGEQGF